MPGPGAGTARTRFRIEERQVQERLRAEDASTPPAPGRRGPGRDSLSRRRPLGRAGPASGGGGLFPLSGLRGRVALCRCHVQRYRRPCPRLSSRLVFQTHFVRGEAEVPAPGPVLRVMDKTRLAPGCWALAPAPRFQEGRRALLRFLPLAGLLDWPPAAPVQRALPRALPVAGAG